MKVSGVAFDLEGTVIDVEAVHHGAFLRLAVELGCPMTFEQAVERIPGFIGGGDLVIVEQMRALAGTQETAEALRRRKLGYYRELLAELADQGKVRLRPGFREVWQALRALRLPMAIGSLTPTDQALELFRFTGISPELFDRRQVVLLEDVGAENKKPKPDVFLRTAAHMGIHPSEQLVFEDSPPGIVAALAAGCPTVAMPVYRSRQVLMQLIAAGAQRIVLDWRELRVEGLLDSLAAG
jgi:beta-phosphoglucomutase